MAEIAKKLGMGWLPDYPDFRDYTAERDKISAKLKLLGQKDSVKSMLKKVGVSKPAKVALPSSVDLRDMVFSHRGPRWDRVMHCPCRHWDRRVFREKGLW